MTRTHTHKQPTNNEETSSNEMKYGEKRTHHWSVFVCVCAYTKS